MIALCVDDESLLLRKLKRAVASSEYISETVAFDDEEDALDWAKTHPVDIAFLDIQLHSMDGIELCRRLREYHPQLFVVFCTGWSEYMLDAFKVHGNGYLLKPIQPEAIREEISAFRKIRELEKVQFMTDKTQIRLIVKLGQGFMVYDRTGVPLTFKRKKAKEMLEILVRQNGESQLAWEISRLLWRGEADYWSDSRQNYFYILTSELKKTLRSVGAEEVLVKEYDGYRLDMSLVEVRE